ncbi:MAG: hypothetical protein E6G59_00400 [Actinobacteria bacterium]|nr:MAG: hypothetical protein E6G59_00400 [Actinomycetota bacterium]
MIAQQLLGDYALDPKGRTWTSPHLVVDVLSQESHCGEAGSALVWLSGLLKETPSSLVTESELSEPGAGGVRFYDSYPSTARDFALVRSGGFEFPVPVLALGRSRGDLARGLLEGIAFGARAGLDVLEEINGAPSEIAVAGGVARARAFREALAGSSQGPLRVATETASSALGAAIASWRARADELDQKAMKMGGLLR